MHVQLSYHDSVEKNEKEHVDFIFAITVDYTFINKLFHLHYTPFLNFVPLMFMPSFVLSKKDVEM